jgi:vacuolar-type H+-ATPase subunit C/Vma6
MAEQLDFAYLYARVCGSFSKMQLGDAARELMQSTDGIIPLWKRLFSEEPPSYPEGRLVFEAERRIISRSISSFLRLAKPYSESNELIRVLISKYEISVIKSMLFRVRAGEPQPEATSYTSDIIEQALAKWPRIDDMFRNTPYQWLSTQSLSNLAVAENNLDKQYYIQLWEASKRITSQKVGAILDLIRREIIYQNVIWSLRVRRYYGMTKEEVAQMLVEVNGIDTTSLALMTFQWDIDKIETFERWPLKYLLAPQVGPTLDIPILEMSAQENLFVAVRRNLHLHPFSYTPIYCYFKLLESETSLILAVLESVRLAVLPDEKTKYMWIPEGRAT